MSGFQLQWRSGCESACTWGNEMAAKRSMHLTRGGVRFLHLQGKNWGHENEMSPGIRSGRGLGTNSPIRSGRGLGTNSPIRSGRSLGTNSRISCSSFFGRILTAIISCKLPTPLKSRPLRRYRNRTIIIFFSPSVVKIPRVKSSKNQKMEWLGIWIVLGLMGNERVSKQNGVEALCGDCNTLEEIGRHPWIPRDLADSVAQILEVGNRRRVHEAQSLESDRLKMVWMGKAYVTSGSLSS